MAMWTYYPDLLARPVPRYTSYPTAAEFDDTVGHDDMASALDALPADEPISLYVHIPYCHEICWYCGCNTGAANRTGRLDAYLARLHQEITLVAERLAGRGKVGRIAFGGGSPNAVSPKAFVALVDHVVTAFRCEGTVLSVELDPRGFGPDWASAIADTGVTRASLGVQSFDPGLQAAIGRVQPEADIRRATDLVRRAGVESINFDLMYGLPGQDDAMLSATLDTAVSLMPDRLAVFGYAHVPTLIPRQRRIDASALPGPAPRFAQALLAHRQLTMAGYDPVGFDHFARPGDALARAATNGTLRRNFQGFTEDQADVLIGMGASAIGQFPDRLLQNQKKAGHWHVAIGSSRFATARGVRRTAQDRVRGHAIEAILCRGAADLGDVPDLNGIRTGLRRFEDVGLIRWRGTRLELASEALPYARAIATTLDLHRAENAVQFSNAV